MKLCDFNIVVVGSGFFGCTIAERIADDLDERVLVIEKRNHIGGNSYSEIDEETGIECHTYGSHIFHTSDEKVWKYVNRFCTFNNYRHKVLSRYGNRVFQMPINLATINDFYGKNLVPAEAEALLSSEIAVERIQKPGNFEEEAISRIGRHLYEAFIKGYTIKQWGIDPRKLPAEIFTRLPLRFNFNSDYFNDCWQGIPLEGYSSIFKKMLDHPNISCLINTDWFSVRHLISEKCLVIYTGPVDRFFDYKYGKLGWRTLTFRKKVEQVRDFQGTAVMNYAELSVPYTRIHEFRHFHEERSYPNDKTVIYYEYSKALAGEDEPYYPINTEKDKFIYTKYLEECEKKGNVIFGGRLGTYRYLNMDEAIAQALETYEEKLVRRR